MSSSDANAPTLRVVTPDEVKALLCDPVVPSARAQAQVILDDVKNEGEAGLLRHAVRLNDLREGESYLKTKEELKAAYDSLPKSEQDLLRRVAGRIESFANRQKGSISNMEMDIPGGKAGHTVAAMEVAGCYAPGGRYPLPSSVLMTAVTARSAGVRTVWVASPRPTAVTLAAAHVAGADGFLALGGAQAIGAFAYGAGLVPACDIIVGPGNRWVTAAKSLVSGRCAIDMLAGPSECLVLADHTACPQTIAADLLAQAEHDTDAVPILVTTSAALVAAVNEALATQLATLPTADTARAACRNGDAVLCADLDEGCCVADKLAPEHLEVMTEKAASVAQRLNHYGGLFVGRNTAEVFGDYGAGPNHVLPTGGTARYSGGLSVFTFLRVRTYLHLDEVPASSSSAVRMLVEDSAALARLEGLEGHARAAEIRLQSPVSVAGAAGAAAANSPKKRGSTVEAASPDATKRSRMA